MGKLEKLKKLFKRKKTVIETPETWVKGKKLKITKQKGMVQLEIKRTKKIRVPGLRTAKRVMAACLLLINFFISQACLMSASATQPLFWLFILNTVILLDYLWKTREKRKIQELIKK